MTECPAVPPPGPDAVDAECERCDKGVRIAQSTAATKRELPQVPLLCWGCWLVLAGEFATPEQPMLAMGNRDFRGVNGLTG